MFDVHNLNLLDVFVTHTNTIHDAFPVTKLIKTLNTTDLSIYATLPQELSLLSNELCTPQATSSAGTKFRTLNYTPLETDGYRSPFVKRYAKEPSIEPYYSGQFSSSYTADKIIKHIFELSELQLQEAERLNLEKPQCWTLDRLTPEELQDLILAAEDQDSAFLTKATLNHILQLTAPTVNLHYPEAFIASPSLIHDDIFFVHILQFQY